MKKNEVSVTVHHGSTQYEVYLTNQSLSEGLIVP